MTDEGPRMVDAEQLEKLSGLFGRTHASISLALVIAATPASMVSSFLLKQTRTRWREGSCSANAERGTTATPAFSTAAAAKPSSSSEIPEASRSTHMK